MLSGITSSELFKQSKIWIKTAAHSVRNFAKNIVSKFTGKKLSDEDLKKLHTAKTEEPKKLDRSKLNEDEIKVLDLKLGEMNTLCKKILPRSGDIGLFFTSPENPKDPLANLMDKTVFNIVRAVSSNQSSNDQDLLDSIEDELAKVIPVHVGAIINDNGSYKIIQSDFRGIKNKLRIEDLDDLTYRSTKYGSVLSLHPAGYTSSPRALIDKYKKTSDQYNYSLSTLIGRGLNVATNGFLNTTLESLEANHENLLAKIKDSKTSANIKKRIESVKAQINKIKDTENNNKNNNIKKNKTKKQKDEKNILDTICVDFIVDDLLNKIVPSTASRKLQKISKESNLRAQMTPSSLEKLYKKEKPSLKNNYVEFSNIPELVLS